MNKHVARFQIATEWKVSFFIFGIWLFYLLVLGFLQAIHLPFGFKVWPMGEDRNWIGFMHDGPRLKMIHLYWQMNDRNPLSAWWWWAASPVIKSSNWGIYIVRKCVDPFLAITTFLLIDRLGRKECRTFAFCAALAVLFWNFSSYYEQIMWEFLVALGFNLLTIYFYCGYIDSERKSGASLALGMLAYFVAIATYTLQAGAMIAIVFLALFRQSESVKPARKTRLISALMDIGFFLAVFVIYNCIWYTVNRNSGVFYVFDVHLFVQQFLASIHKFFYHPFYTQLINLILSDWSAWESGLIFILSAVFVSAIIFFAKKNQIINDKIKLPIAWVVLVLASIVVPTILVESTSQIWYPGSRSLMVQQVWQPLFYLLVIFALGNYFYSEKTKYIYNVVLSIVVLFVAVIMLAGFNYNSRLVVRTGYQVLLSKELKKIAPADRQRYFLVKFVNPDIDLNTISNLISNTGQTMLKQDNVSIRTFQSAPDPEQSPFWIIKFNENGVNNAAPIGNNALIPYSNVWIVFFDGKKVWLPKTVNKQDFTGLQVDWQRNKQIDQMNK